MKLLARLVVALGFHETFLILWRQLRPVYLYRELIELAGEFEWHLIVLVVYRCAGVGADVEGLVPLHDERDRVVHLLGGDFLAVHLKHAGAGLANAAEVIERQRFGAETFVLEVKLHGVSAGRERLRAFGCASGRPGSRETPACP